MEFKDLIEKVSFMPAFTPGFLAAGENLAQVRLQISRWVNAGKVIKIHKGLYTLAEPYRKNFPEPFCIANSLKQASYVSLQSALSWYGIIPEYVPSFVSITTGRPQTIETPMGRFDFRCVNKKYFWGYHQIELRSGQKAFVAYPEKALLDLIYLTSGGDDLDFLKELRLQSFDTIDMERLERFCSGFHSPKISRACTNLKEIIYSGEGQSL